jgi:hypothetical protein
LLVLLDMHTLSYPETNEGLWCGFGSGCTNATEAPLIQAWSILATRTCDAHPNVIGADLVRMPCARRDATRSCACMGMRMSS